MFDNAERLEQALRSRSAPVESARLDPDARDDRKVEFDPLEDDLAEAARERVLLAESLAEASEGDALGTAALRGLRAWNFLIETVGLDLRAIARRWKVIPPVLVPIHVWDRGQGDDARSALTLLDDAIRAYVFGAHRAALAMCRAVMETVLKKHYGRSEESLASLIVLAERKPEIRRLRLKQHKRLADDALHEARQVEEAAVLEFLKVAKALIELAPSASPAH